MACTEVVCEGLGGGVQAGKGGEEGDKSGCEVSVHFAW